ncbi:MAG: MFS transporter [Desulfohalobiaceae bacterium]
MTLGILEGVFRSLHSRNYRLYIAGQGISLVGRWIHQPALYWLAYRMTDSPVSLGLIGFAQFVPVFFTGPLAGGLADRLDKRRLLLACQVLGALTGLILAWMFFAGTLTFSWLLVLTVAVGVVQSFDTPLRQSLLVDLVRERSELGNAIALNAAVFNASRLIGPALAGVIISLWGEGVCFLLNGLSFVPMVFALTALDLEPVTGMRGVGGMFGHVREGMRSALGDGGLRPVIVIAGLFSLLGLPYVLLMPILARDVLGTGSGGYGTLLSCSGCGALTGALYMAGRRSLEGLDRLVRIFAGLFSVCIAGLAVSSSFFISAGLLFVVGVSQMIQLASCNTLVQAGVEDEKRGRVLSIYYMFLFGMVPFGHLAAGQLTGLIGVRATLVVFALLYGAVSGVVARGLQRPRPEPE